MSALVFGRWRIEGAADPSRPGWIVVEFPEPSDGPWRIRSRWLPLYEDAAALDRELRGMVADLIKSTTGVLPVEVGIVGRDITASIPPVKDAA